MQSCCHSNRDRCSITTSPGHSARGALLKNPVNTRSSKPFDIDLKPIDVCDVAAGQDFEQRDTRHDYTLDHRRTQADIGPDIDGCSADRHALAQEVQFLGVVSWIEQRTAFGTVVAVVESEIRASKCRIYRPRADCMQNSGYSWSERPPF